MADGKKDGPTIEQRLDALTRELDWAKKQIRSMQNAGGFADSAMLSKRSNRIEQRLEKVEFDTEMLKDVAARSQSLLEDHLRDRHDADLNRDDAIDVRNWRWIRNRMKEWAEKRGLMDKKRDLSSARSSENRLRPQAAH